MHAINQQLPIQARMFESELDSGYIQYMTIPKCGAIITHPHKGQNLYLIVTDRRTGKEGFPKGRLEHN